MPHPSANDRNPEVALESTEVSIPDLGFSRLVWSDYRFHHADRPESNFRAALLFLPRLLLNPSLQLAFLVRVGQCGPSFLLHPVRWLQVVLFSSEVYWFRGEERIRIGAAINFPHPENVMIGPRSTIGSFVTIYNNTEIGSDRGGLPWELDASRVSTIGDGVSVYPYSAVLGPYTVGHNAVIGLGVTLDEDVPPGGLKTKRHLKLAGEWQDPRRAAAVYQPSRGPASAG
jgi:serine acetyltransferase